MTPPTPDALLCYHANEVPNRCKCPATCYCKSHTCKADALSQEWAEKEARRIEEQNWYEPEGEDFEKNVIKIKVIIP